MRRARAVLTRSLGDVTFRAAVTGGSWALVGTVVGRLANAAAFLYAAAILGSADFGTVSLVLSTTFVVTSVSALGLPVAAVKLVAGARAGQDDLIAVAVRLTLVSGATSAIVFLAAGSFVAGTVIGVGAVAPLLAVATPLVVLTPLAEIYAALLGAVERFRDVSAFRAMQGLVTGAALVVVLLLRPDGAAAIGGLVAAEVAVCVVGATLLSRARPGRGTRNVRRPRGTVRALLRIAMPALAASLSLQPALWIGQVVLSRQPGGIEQVGQFAVAYRWHAIALFVPSTMGSVLLPMLGRLRATDDPGAARLLFLRYGALTCLFAGTTGLLLLVLAAPLMALQGSQYAAGTAILGVLAVAVIPTAVNNVLSQMALAEGRLALWVWSDVALAVTLAVSAAVLVPWLAGVGLAWSYVLAYVVTSAVLLPVAWSAWRGRVAT